MSNCFCRIWGQLATHEKLINDIYPLSRHLPCYRKKALIVTVSTSKLRKLIDYAVSYPNKLQNIADILETQMIDDLFQGAEPYAEIGIEILCFLIRKVEEESVVNVLEVHIFNILKLYLSSNDPSFIKLSRSLFFEYITAANHHDISFKSLSLLRQILLNCNILNKKKIIISSLEMLSEVISIITTRHSGLVEPYLRQIVQVLFDIMIQFPDSTEKDTSQQHNKNNISTSNLSLQCQPSIKMKSNVMLPNKSSHNEQARADELSDSNASVEATAGSGSGSSSVYHKQLPTRGIEPQRPLSLSHEQEDTDEERNSMAELARLCLMALASTPFQPTFFLFLHELFDEFDCLHDDRQRQQQLQRLPWKPTYLVSDTLLLVCETACVVHARQVQLCHMLLCRVKRKLDGLVASIMNEAESKAKAVEQSSTSGNTGVLSAIAANDTYTVSQAHPPNNETHIEGILNVVLRVIYRPKTSSSIVQSLAVEDIHILTSLCRQIITLQHLKSVAKSSRSRLKIPIRISSTSTYSDANASRQLGAIYAIDVLDEDLFRGDLTYDRCLHHIFDCLCGLSIYIKDGNGRLTVISRVLSDVDDVIVKQILNISDDDAAADADKYAGHRDTHLRDDYLSHRLIVSLLRVAHVIIRQPTSIENKNESSCDNLTHTSDLLATSQIRAQLSSITHTMLACIRRVTDLLQREQHWNVFREAASVLLCLLTAIDCSADSEDVTTSLNIGVYSSGGYCVGDNDESSTLGLPPSHAPSDVSGSDSDVSDADTDTDAAGEPSAVHEVKSESGADTFSPLLTADSSASVTVVAVPEVVLNTLQDTVFVILCTARRSHQGLRLLVASDIMRVLLELGGVEAFLAAVPMLFALGARGFSLLDSHPAPVVAAATDAAVPATVFSKLHKKSYLNKSVIGITESQWEDIMSDLTVDEKTVLIAYQRVFICWYFRKAGRKFKASKRLFSIITSFERHWGIRDTSDLHSLIGSGTHLRPLEVRQRRGVEKVLTLASKREKLLLEFQKTEHLQYYGAKLRKAFSAPYEEPTARLAAAQTPPLSRHSTRFPPPSSSSQVSMSGESSQALTSRPPAHREESAAGGPSVGGLRLILTPVLKRCKGKVGGGIAHTRSLGNKAVTGTASAAAGGAAGAGGYLDHAPQSPLSGSDPRSPESPDPQKAKLKSTYSKIINMKTPFKSALRLARNLLERGDANEEAAVGLNVGNDVSYQALSGASPGPFSGPFSGPGPVPDADLGRTSIPT